MISYYYHNDPKIKDLPKWLVHILDRLFDSFQEVQEQEEEEPSDESKQFVVDFLDAIPVGVNLEPIKWKLSAFILKENIHSATNLKHISEELCKQIINVTQQVLKLYEEAINTGVWIKNDAVIATAESTVERLWMAATNWENDLDARDGGWANWLAMGAWKSAQEDSQVAGDVWGAPNWARKRYVTEVLRLLKEEGNIQHND